MSGKHFQIVEREKEKRDTERDTHREKMRSAGRRNRSQQESSFQPPPPTPTAADPWNHHHHHRRDSDASFASSRPSSVGTNRSSAAAALPITDRSHQVSAVRTVNSYLASHSSQISLRTPLPSAKDITETLKFILAQLDFPTNKIDEDAPLVLKHLQCPIKLNKSALKAPGTPHSWPSLLAVIHWLVQVAMFSDSISDQSIFEENGMLTYSVNSYLHFIRGEDESVEMLDSEFADKLQQAKDVAVEKVMAIEGNVRDLESKLEALKTEPSAKELLEKESSMLQVDVKKFHSMIEQLKGLITSNEKILEEKEKELDVKIEENKRIQEENGELKKRVDEQGINSRDAERMKRELQAIERDIGEAEVSRNGWEEKSWDLDAAIGHKFKELEALSIECNQSIKRLKLGKDLQFKINAKGSTPAEVLGIDHKLIVKPTLAIFADDNKKGSIAKVEELISLRQKSVENATKIEGKRNFLTLLQTRIDEGEAQMDLIMKETQEFTSKCVAEAEKMVADVESDAKNLDMVEREAAEFLKTSKLRLQEAKMADEEETQMCARELLATVDLVSKHKEYVASKILEMRTALSENIVSVLELYKGPST